MNNTSIEKYIRKETQNYLRRIRRHHTETKEFKHSVYRRRLLEMVSWAQEIKEMKSEEEYVFA